MTKLDLTTLASGTSFASLKDRSGDIQKAEGELPENTMEQLTLSFSLPGQARAGFDWAVTRANDLAKSQGVLTWEGQSDVVSSVGDSAVVRWRRGQLFWPIVIGLVVVSFIALAVWMNGWRYEKGEFVNVQTGTHEGWGKFITGTIPKDLGKTVEGTFNNLPLVIGIGAVALFGVIYLVGRGHQTVVQLYDPNGARQAQRTRSRSMRERQKAQQASFERSQRAAEAAQRRAEQRAQASHNRSIEKLRIQASRPTRARATPRKGS